CYVACIPVLLIAGRKKCGYSNQLSREEDHAGVDILFVDQLCELQLYCQSVFHGSCLFCFKLL
ncbi:hypothetical protein HAX54_000528, partial [Datura stramonium]|nr:hypothetical protein [Datura stramonium]